MHARVYYSQHGVRLVRRCAFGLAKKKKEGVGWGVCAVDADTVAGGRITPKYQQSWYQRWYTNVGTCAGDQMRARGSRERCIRVRAALGAHRVVTSLRAHRARREHHMWGVGQLARGHSVSDVGGPLVREWAPPPGVVVVESHRSGRLAMP